MSNKTVIISAFPASGKSYLFNNQKLHGFSVLDSDSSMFSWILDENGKSTGERNPKFPENYIHHIKENLGKVDIIMVSSHDEVKVALEEHNLPYTLIMPSKVLKHEWLGRCWMRGNPDGFLRLIAQQWDAWTNQQNLLQEFSPNKLITLQSGEYISNKCYMFKSLPSLGE